MSREGPLERARSYFEYANAHPVITAWRAKAQEDYGFYDGDGQWEPEILQQLQERGQAAITVNKIKPLVNFLSGVEIQTRFRMAFRSHSGRVEDDRLAKALTHLGYFVQEHQDIPYKASLKFRDSLITGLGWSQLYKDKHGIAYEQVHPLNMVFDPDDLSPNLSAMQFVARLRWYAIEEAKRLWPRESSYWNNLFHASPQSGSTSGEANFRQASSLDLYTSGDGGSGSRVLVVEVQYKDYDTAYAGFDGQGRMFQTFSKQEAWELDPTGAFDKTTAARIQRVLFTGDRLLEHGPLRPAIPNLPDFTYIPIVWSRRLNGVPDGWLSSMKDLQRESNYRRAKLVNNLSSFRAEVEANAMPGMSVDQIREELKRPDSILLKTPGTVLNIQSNIPLAQGQFEMLMQVDRELQQVSGIHDDALGKPTNAESGVAIEKRQVNSVRSQVFAFDNLRLMKKREGRLLLHYFQGGGDTFLEAQILDENEKETILLNAVRYVDGQRVMFNDIRTLPLSIYVEEVPDFESSAEEQQANLVALLGNAHAPLIMQSPLFMKRLGIRDYESLANEMQQVMAKDTALNQETAIPS